MLRPAFLVLLTALSLSSCDKIVKTVMKGGSGNKPIAEQVRISSPDTPAIVAGFEAIAKATLEHNRVLLANYDNDKPANELAADAGIAQLEQSARGQTGLARKIIDGMAMCHAYEKTLFTPFDTLNRQGRGMPTWTKDEALQRRGYIQLLDQEMVIHDNAVAYLERGEDPAVRKYFNYQGVPKDVTEEFIRLRRESYGEIAEGRDGMFREARLSLQTVREALATNDAAKANELLARSKQHEQKAKDYEKKMLEGLRKQIGGDKMP